jgi:hypothetical protein
MGLEKSGRHGHTVGSHRPKAMIQENGDIEGPPG